MEGARTTDILYTYDAAGRLRSRTGARGTTVYDYDAQDRLHLVSGPATGTVAYAYDAQGRRIGRLGPAGAHAFVVDPNNPTGYTQVVAEHDTAGHLQADYTWGLGLLRQSRAGAVHYYHPDASHNVRLLTDAAGNVTDRYDYEAFGPPVATTGTTENAYRFAGERLDPDTGLTYLRARYYDPNSGRFISRDPNEGHLRDPMSLHRYLYANVNPAAYQDPTGRFSIVETEASMAIVGGVMKGYTSMLGNTFIAVRKNIRTYITLGSAGYNVAINLLSAGYVTPSVINLANNSRTLIANGFKTIRKTIGSQLRDYFKTLLILIKIKILDLVSFDLGSLFSNITSGKAPDPSTYMPNIEGINNTVDLLNTIMGDGVLVTRMMLEDRNLVAESMNMRMNEDMAALSGSIDALLRNNKP